MTLSTHTLLCGHDRHPSPELDLPKVKLCAHLHPNAGPWQLPFHFLSLRVTAEVPHISGVIRCLSPSSGLFHLASCPDVASVAACVRIPFLSTAEWWSLCGCPAFGFSTHSSVGTRVASTLWLSWVSCCEHRCAKICLRACFQLFWVYTQKWNCWVVWEFFI